MRRVVVSMSAVILTVSAVITGLVFVISEARAHPSDNNEEQVLEKSITAQGPAGQSPQTQISDLKKGQTVERVISGGETHTYQVTLKADQYINVVAQQRVDIELKLIAPDGKPFAQIDWQGKDASESLWALAESPGEYKLEIVVPNKLSKAGQYTIRIDQIGEWETASQRDRNLIIAHRMFWEANKLRDEGKAASLTKAIDKYKEALPLWRAVEDRTGEANTLNEIGFVLARLGRRSEAIGFYDQALSLWRVLGNKRDESIVLINLSTSYRILGELQEALRLLEQALSIGQLLKDHLVEASALNSIGAVYTVLGESQTALEYYNRSLPISRERGDKGAEARTLNNMSLSYAALGDYHKALECLGQALPIRRLVKDQRGEALTLNNLGVMHARIGEVQKALEYYDRSLSLSRTVGDRDTEAYSLSNKGNIYASLGETEKALDYHQQSLVLRSAVGDSFGEAYTLSNMGSCYASLNDYPKALDYYRRALELNRAVGDRDGEVNTLYLIARAKADQGHLAEAAIQADEGLKLIEAKRGKVLSPELRTSYLASNQDFYQFQIDLLMQLHDQQPSAGHDAAAYHACERARARGLLDLLSEARTGVRQGIDANLKQRERAIHSRISWLQYQLLQLNSRAKPDQTRIAALEVEFKKSEDERQQLEEEIRSRHPRYANLHYPVPLGLESIQRVLDDKTALLEYSLGKKGSFLFVISKDDFRAIRLPSSASVPYQVQQLREAIARGPDQSALPNYFLNAHSLYESLIQPALKVLAGKRSLVIVPDGILYYLPFEVLLKSAPGAVARKDLRRLPYLVRDYAISYAPSGTVLAFLLNEKKGQSPEKKFLAYGDPVYDGVNSGENDSIRSSIGEVFGESKPWKLRSLPHSREEVQRIAKLYPQNQVDLFLREQASEANVKGNHRLSQYQYVHLAVHGLLNEARPQYSGLILSLPPRQPKEETFADSKGLAEEERAPTDQQGDSQIEDGLLQVYEIFDLNLNADVVVLSACETGLGKEVKGEGLVGLTRAFLYAGARSLLVSLWKVEDRSTAQLMERFYRFAEDKSMSKSEALRKAQLELINNGVFSHPYRWGGFILIGIP